VGEKAENQRKTMEKSKVAEIQVFWLDFCGKKRNVKCAVCSVHTSLGMSIEKDDIWGKNPGANPNILLHKCLGFSSAIVCQ
jgi:hypothetical protein